MSEPFRAVEFNNANKSYNGKPALCGLTMHIAAGTFHVVLGANGAGKTTALRSLCGLETLDSGDVRVFGIDVAKDPIAVKRRIAFLPDSPLLYGMLRPYEYLEFVAALWDVAPHEVKQKSESLMARLGLTEYSGKFIHGLSHGTKQKLALAGALIHSPDLIVLDEPLTGLDVRSARVVKDLLLALIKTGVTVILTTHVLDVAERLADSVSIIHDGRVIAQGSVAELRANLSPDSTLEEIYLSVLDAAL